MIFGLHVLLYSKNAEDDRKFFRDVLGFKAVDVGGGWLIFRTPPTEMAVHPLDGESGQSHAGHAMSGAVLYLMCDDLRKTVKDLAKKRVKCTEVEKEEWGIRTTIPLPSGGEIGLYQPTHKVALKR
jgi:catechol 2,3-dioxygenase-like lactoylglutathione lyase family enzyme